jgi:hypothetical protein
LRVRADGGDVRVVYSPLDAVTLAQKHPDREVVFFAVGFETTAPANSMAVWQAAREGLTNFSILVSHVLVPPAVRLLPGFANNRVKGFIAPGHVCAIMGYTEYEELARDFKTADKSYGPIDIELSDQLTTYQIAEPEVPGLALWVLIKTNEPKIEWYPTKRGPERLAEFLGKAAYAAREIKAEEFYKRSGIHCSWCDFLPVCLGQKEKVEQTLVRMAGKAVAKITESQIDINRSGSFVGSWYYDLPFYLVYSNFGNALSHWCASAISVMRARWAAMRWQPAR